MILCADDYGLRDDIDAAILELGKARRISAVSCMVALARCDSARLEKLLPGQDALDIGLHLCFTNEGLPWTPGAAQQALGGAPSFSALLKRALKGRIKTSEVLDQVTVQYELFVKKTGRHPDHLDGHLHAHQLPGVREALVQFVLSLPMANRPYIRNTAMPLRNLWRRRLPWTKAALIGAFGVRLNRRMRQAGLRTNQGFAGIYDFAKWRRYPEYFPKFAHCLLDQPNGILVVHPGKDEAWRRQEYLALQAFAFPPGSPNRFQAAPAQSPFDHGSGATATSAMPLLR